MTKTQKKKQTTKAKQSRSKLFIELLNQIGIDGVVEEYRFTERRYRFDYAVPSVKLAIEVEGGVYTRGAHGSITGILRDIEKYNLAVSMGWSVLRILPKNLFQKETFELILKTYSNLSQKPI